MAYYYVNVWFNIRLTKMKFKLPIGYKRNIIQK